MGIWNFYFIAKLFLYFGNYIGFHALLNLAFAFSLAIAIPHQRLRLLRQVIAIPVGIVLFYHDTWLPPIKRVFSQASQLQGFSLSYAAELAGRFFHPLVVAGVLLLYGVYFFTKKKLRISSFVFLVMLIPLLPDSAKFPGIYHRFAKNSTASAEADQSSSAASAREGAEPPTDMELTASLNSFYREEGKRRVSISPPPSRDEPFDIIFLQICSLSLDDLSFTKEQNNPLFKHFNIVFTNFSSAASYSGPAVIRLLRGSCGQQKQSRLYDASDPQCQTFNDLMKVGFEPQLALNHDGHYGGFLDDVRERGGLKATPFDTRGMPDYLQSFDGTPVHNDFAVLTKWWKSRLNMPAKRVALFYNTISLHDGNRYSDNRSASSMEIYHPRQTRLLGDIDRFINEIKASKRRAVVIFVAEHGASVRGDKMQIAGLREIPTPRISIVPVGIKLIGRAENPAGKPLIISKPSSYLAISQLLSNFTSRTPFSRSSPRLEEYVRNLPTTEFVAEDEDIVVMRRNHQYFINSKDETWLEYQPD